MKFVGVTAVSAATRRQRFTWILPTIRYRAMQFSTNGKLGLARIP
ncbi:MAG: hypothetical protein Q8R28_22065 [Dehalococcoidia bacterium]|nr:hypothetical protein [Dehalococcoidia bacterium]